jgi:hypothetical protein
MFLTRSAFPTFLVGRPVNVPNYTGIPHVHVGRKADATGVVLAEARIHLKRRSLARRKAGRTISEEKEEKSERSGPLSLEGEG